MLRNFHEETTWNHVETASAFDQLFGVAFDSKKFPVLIAKLLYAASVASFPASYLRVPGAYSGMCYRRTRAYAVIDCHSLKQELREVKLEVKLEMRQELR